ncbi:hypothetical protein CMO91_03960 [Candidatus Woesearchaeota archaeon]|nr:hypothetical protein [Candidatus Woesearchaeota archaeon]|tara:strand:- start:1989 stop:2600 length:612 start_codon:yes stop_codon:yes gene_type:complete
MDILYEAIWLMWKKVDVETEVRYSGRFKGYNANIQRKGNLVTLNLAKQWKRVSKDIRLGIAQLLACKLLKKKEQTLYIDLYHNFMKHAHLGVLKTKSDPQLEASFSRVNEEYFSGMIEPPNLIWGKHATRTLGTYDYGTDTIRISAALQDEELLDYVMYHELLHKHLKFKHGKSTRYHTKQFRTKEKQFKNALACEQKLKRLC